MDEAFWQELLCVIIRNVVDMRYRVIRNPQALQLLVDQMIELTTTSALARSRSLHALSSNSLKDPLQHFLSDERDTYSPLRESSVIGRDLDLALIRLILGSALNAQAEDVGIDTSLALRLLDKQQKIANRSVMPMNISRRARIAVSLFEQPCTPQEQGASLQWRQKLAAELGTDSKLRSEAIIRTVEQVCRDLEERCEVAEEPLRLEQERHTNLREQHDVLQQHIQGLEAQLASRNAELACVEHVKSRAEDDLVSVSAERAMLTHKIQGLQDQLRYAEEQADETVARMRREYESQKLELSTIIACHVERLDEQEDKLTRTERQLHESAQLLCEQRASDGSIQESLQRSLESVETALRIEKATNAEKDSEIGRLTTQEMSLSGNIEHLRQEIQESGTRHEQLISEHQALKDSYERQVGELRAEHDGQIRESTNQLISAQREFEDKRRTYETEQAKARHRNNEEIQSRDQEIQELRQKVQWYSKQCKYKTGELEEAHKLKTRLLTAMGVNANQAHPSKMNGAVRGLETDSEPRTVNSRNSRLIATSPPRATDESDTRILEPLMEPLSSFGSGSSSKSEPTPKRAKPRLAFNVPSMGQPTLNGATEAVHSSWTGVLSARLPLEEMSTSSLNRRRRSRTRRSESAVMFQARSELSVHGKHHYSDGEADSMDKQTKCLAEAGSSDSVAGKENTSPRKVGRHHHALMFEDLDIEDFDGTTVEL